MMRLFGGKENEMATAALDATPLRSISNNTRKFGTPLTSNPHKTPDHNKTRPDETRESGVKKVVRVRLTPQSSSKKSAHVSFPPIATQSSSNEKTVVFSPGPVGLQLEPVNQDPVYGCRVVRFVDGGPKNPGQARKSGKIKPGDWVLKVEAEGTFSAATTYEEILSLLKNTHVKRILTVKSIWDESMLEGAPPPESGVKPTPTTSFFIPTRKPSLFCKPATQNNRFTPSKPASHAIPPSVPENDVLSTPERTSSMSNELVKSPSEMVLLSRSFDDVSRISSSSSSLRKSTTDGPLIVPINVISMEQKETQNVSVNSREEQDNEDQFSDGEDSITRSRSPSMFSEQTAKSSNKSHYVEEASQALADQFLLFEGFTGAMVPESPYVVSRSQSTTTDNEHDVENPETPVQELTYSPNSSRISDSVESQLRHQQELLDQSLLRADFEQRLEAARTEYSKTERELKELYIQTCERNEIKIQELQSNNLTLRKKVNGLHATKNKLQEESAIRSLELDMSKTMVKELESRLITLETEKNETAIRFNQACDSIEELEKSNEQKDRVIASKTSEIESLNYRFRLLEDELSRETNQRKSSRSRVLNLESQLCGKVEQIDVLEKQLGTYHSRLEQKNSENEELRGKLQSFEREKAEALALAEHLSQSVEEKQKALVTGRSIISRLESETESLSKQIADTNMDVENLLREKLAMEAKFADTWKDFQQAKKDASTIHETLMEKLENGEFFTTADIEVRQSQVDALRDELRLVREQSFEEVMHQTRNAVNIHLKLNFLARVLQNVQSAKDSACIERDEYRDAMGKIKEFVESAKKHVQNAKDEFESVRGENLSLRDRVESLRRENDKVAASFETRMESAVQEIEAQKLALKKLAQSKEECEQHHLSNQARLQEQLNSANNELLSTQWKLEKVAENVSDVTSSKMELLRKLNEVEANKMTLETEYQKKKNDLDSLRGKVASAERALSIFAQRLSQSKSSEDAVSQKYDAIVAEKASMESSFHSTMMTMEAELNSLREREGRRDMVVQAAKIEMEQEVGNHKLVIKRLSEEIQDKEGKLLHAQSTIRQLKEEQITGQAEHVKLEQELKSLRLTTTQTEHSYKEQLGSLQSTLKAREDSLEAAKVNFEKLQEEVICIKAEFVAKAESLTSSREESKAHFKEKVETLRLEIESKIKDFETKQSEWAEKERVLFDDIESLRMENNRAGELYRQDIASLTLALSTAESYNVSTMAQLKEREFLDSVTVEHLREQLNFVKKEAEVSATTYWEDLRGLTAELQSKDELLSCAESRMEDLEREIVVLEQSLKDVKNEIFNANAEICQMQSDLAIRAQHIDCSEAQRSNLVVANTELESKLADLERLLSEKRDVEFSLQNKISSLEDEKKEQEMKLIGFLTKVDRLQDVLKNEQSRGELLVLELEEKTRQLEIQTDKASGLHEQMASLASLAEDLENDVETLRASLSIEKAEKEQAMADAADTKMEMNIQTNKLSSEIVDKEHALCASENSRLKLARSLLQANALIASHKVQLKEAAQTDLLHQNSMREVERLQHMYNLATNEAQRAEESFSFLNAVLRERDSEFLAQTKKLDDANREVTDLRDRLVKKEQDATSLARDLEFATTESSHLKEIVAEAEQLHQIIETKSNQIQDLETTLSQAEHYAVVAFDSLELAQQSENGLREKLSDLRNCLRKEVQRLMHAHGSPINVTKGNKKNSSENSPLRDQKPTLEYELSSISQEMESLSALIDKRSADVDALHKTVSDLAAKLSETEDSSEQQKETLKVSIFSHKAQLQCIEASHQDHILELQKQVLNARASCIAIQLRKRRLQKTVAVEKTDLLKNIENLSARLLSIQEFQRTSNEKHGDEVLSLKKSILKFRAEFIVKHLQSKNLEKDVRRLEKEQEFIKAALSSATESASSLGLALHNRQAEINHFISAGSDIGDLLHHLIGQVEEMASNLKQRKKEITDKELTIDSMTSNIQGLQLLKDRLIDDNKGLQAALIRNKSIVERLEEDLLSLSRELETEKERNDKLANEGVAAQAANIALRDTIKSLRSSLSDAELQVLRSNGCVETLEDKLLFQTLNSKKLEQSLNITNGAMERFQWIVEQLCAKVERVEADKQTIEESRTNLLRDVAEMRQTFNDIQRERDESRDEIAREYSTMNSTLEQRDSQVIALQTEIQTKDQSISSLKVRLCELEEEQKGLIIALAKFSEALEVERLNVRTLDSVNGDMEEQMQSLKEQYVLLKAALEKSTHQHAETKKEQANLEAEHLSRIGYLEKTVTALQKNLQDVELEALNMIEQIKQTKEMNQHLQVENEILEPYRCKFGELNEELERRILQTKQQERHIVDLEESLDNLHRGCYKKDTVIAEKTLQVETLAEEVSERDSKIAQLEERISALAATVESLTENLHQLSVDYNHGLSDDMESHVVAVKEAFRKQTDVLEDLKLSENVLSNFMSEVMCLANKAETEALELSSTLNSVEDLLIRPSSCLASLDLAGIGAANEYVEEVRTRLEDMAALAYNTSVELKVRQNEFHRWKSSRQTPPSIPVTPPSKPLKRVLFDTTTTSGGAASDVQRQMAGARVLNCVVENRSKMELASAFRKWSCCAGVISASHTHTETAAALAQQLDQTREKLLMLKTHLKGKQQKPRLRRILDRLDSNSYHVNHDKSLEI